MNDSANLREIRKLKLKHYQAFVFRILEHLFMEYYVYSQFILLFD
jgi:hypothetical protein